MYTARSKSGWGGAGAGSVSPDFLLLLLSFFPVRNFCSCGEDPGPKEMHVRSRLWLAACYCIRERERFLDVVGHTRGARPSDLKMPQTSSSHVSVRTGAKSGLMQVRRMAFCPAAGLRKANARTKFRSKRAKQR